MFRNYLAAALRNLVRNKFFAALNILGLTVGFFAALLIALFVRDELSYDTWLPEAAKVHMLSAKLPSTNGEPLYFNMVPVDIAPAMKLDFPEIDKIVRLQSWFYAVRHNSVETAEQLVYFADPDFFSVIQFPAVAGDLKTALAEPDGAVLTLAAARKYFGKDAPIGERLELIGRNPTITTGATVTAVIEDLPSNTQFNTEIILSSRSEQSAASRYAKDPLPPGLWNGGLAYTYFTLKPGSSIAKIDRGLSMFVKQHKAADIPFVGPAPLYTLPMTGLHLDDRPARFDRLTPHGNRSTANSIAIIGLLILFIAGVNFVNISTARASRRAIEVGMRRVVGAAWIDLVVQFIGESFLYVTFAIALSIVAVLLALPAFNAYLGRTILFDFWADPKLLGGIVATTLLAALAAGAYPAFVLSRFRPKAVLRSATVRSGASAVLRNLLVTLQFAVLMGLILSTVVMYRQMDFMLNRGTHLDKTRVHVISPGCKPAFIDAVRAMPGVEAAACSDGVLFNDALINRSITTPGATELAVSMSQVDIGTLEFYGLQPLAGRFFSPAFPGDRRPDPPPQVPGRAAAPPLPFTYPVVINETLARQLSPGNPAAAVGMTVVPNINGTRGASQVIGIVQDFALDLIHKAIPPTVYTLFSRQSMAAGGYLNVKLHASADEGATLEALEKTWKLHYPGYPYRFSIAPYLKDLNAEVIRQSQLFAAFAIVAVFVATLGLFGLSAFAAETRTKEIGIRKALGATRGEIVRLLLRQFTEPVLWANLIAWPGAYLILGRWLEGFAYHVEMAPWMFLGTSVLALVVAILTVAGHTLLVARTEPATALRYE